MINKSLDVIAVGSCYIDINTNNFPFSNDGIPIEKELIGNRYEIVAGGSAVNFCKLLQKLGLETAFIGMVGADPNGDILKSLLSKEGILPLLIHDSQLLTNISFNMTNPQGKHIMLAAGTANGELTPEVVIPLLKEKIIKTKMLYLGGCFKLQSFVSSFGEIEKLVINNERMLVVDHGRIPDGIGNEMLEAVKGLVLLANYYFPSRDEFCRLWNVEDIKNGLQLLNEHAPKLIVIVKDGENGAYYWDGSLQHVEAEKVGKVINITGAGDSFNAGVMAAVIAGQSILQAVQNGCKVAAIKISGEENY